MAGPPGGAGPAVSTLVLPNGGPGRPDARPRGTGPASGNGLRCPGHATVPSP